MSLLPTFYAEDTPASANETWARLHNDPLFAVRVCIFSVFMYIKPSCCATMNRINS